MYRSVLFFLLIANLLSCEPSAKVKTEPASDKQTELAQRMDNYLQSASSLGFSGSIIVAQGDSILLQKGYGLADRKHRSPYTANTIQTCGSVTKQFTGAAILLLESENSLSLEDSLSTYFNEAPAEYRAITIHQLLTHSAGIIGGLGPDEEPISKDEFLSRLWSEPLEFEPGTGHHYSNAGYSLLGMIIEQVTSMSYEEYLRAHLFIPSGMQDTGYLSIGKDSSQLAQGYLKGDHWGLVYQNGWLKDGPNWHLRANGGIHTTAEDMFKWFQVIRGKGVLSDASIQKWTTGYVYENNDDSKYAYGLVEYEDPDFGRVINHNGSNRIFSADLFWFPEKDLFLYIQANSSLYPAYEISHKVLEAAFESTFSPLPAYEVNNNAYPAKIKQWEGTYSLENSFVELNADDIRLTAKLNGQSMLDQFYQHSSEQQKLFASMNKKTEKAMHALFNGEKDALKDLMPEDADVIKATARLQGQIDRIGNLESLNVIGTFENAENSRFSEIGAYTTFVYARFKYWNRYWNFVFDRHGNYLGAYSGPWPSFTLLPQTETKFKAVQQEPPYKMATAVFQDNHLILNGKKISKK